MYVVRGATYLCSRHEQRVLSGVDLQMDSEALTGAAQGAGCSHRRYSAISCLSSETDTVL